MNTWFTSDEHFGHFNIIKFCNRPFSSLEEMNESLIERHNEVVKDGDDVYHVGDCFWRTYGYENALKTVRRWNGNHFYVLGNHEELILNNQLGQELRDEFVWVAEREVIRPSKMYPKIVLDHYAGRVWRGSGGGSIQLYGHSHGELEATPHGKSMDVGVDSHNYYPVSLDQVMEVMGNRK